MKFLFSVLSLVLSIQSFAFEVHPRKNGPGYMVVCANGNSGGKFDTFDDAKQAGKDLCRGRGELKGPKEAMIKQPIKKINKPALNN